MTDLISEGYPPGYHSGIAAILWILLMIILGTVGVRLLIKSKLTKITHQRQIFLGSGMVIIGAAVGFFIIHMGVLLPDYFYIYYSGGFAAFYVCYLIMLYYWGKNLVMRFRQSSMIIGIISLMITLLIFFIVLSTGIYSFKLMPLITMALILASGIGFLISFFVFAMNVEGKLRFHSFIVIISFILANLTTYLDHPPGLLLFPEFSLYFCPISFTICFFLIGISSEVIADELYLYYNQEQICMVHRGKILKGETISYCPKCSTIYCKKCFELVIKIDGCWNCKEKFLTKEEKKLESEESLEEVEVLMNEDNNLSIKKRRDNTS